MESKHELQRNVIEKARKLELDSYQRALDMQWLDSRMEDGRMGLSLALIEQEAKMEKDFQEAEENQANRVLAARYNDMEQTDSEEQAKMDQNSQYSKDLQQQLASKQRVRQCQYEDTLVEKKMQESVMRILADEDQRELQHKRDSTEQMRQEMVTFQEERESWKQKQKGMVMVEERKIEEQRQAASNRSSVIEAERQRKMQVREEQIEKMGRKGLEDAEKIQERADIIRSLGEQEYLEKHAQDDSAQIARTELYRVEAKQDRVEHLQWRAQQARDQHDEDMQFRKESDELLERGDKIELENERKKKERNQQYSEDLRMQIEGNASRRKAEKDLELKLDRERNDQVEAWHSKVAHEREGHFQSGVVNHDDMPVVRSGSTQHEDLATLDSDELLEHGDEIELENERKKKERNQQYSEDLRMQIEGNASRRKAEKDLELKLDRERNDQVEAWHSKVAHEREGHFQSGVVNHDDMPVVRSRSAQHEDLATLDVGALSVSESPNKFPNVQ